MSPDIEKTIRRLKKDILTPITPFLVQAGASLGAYTTGLAAVQGLGMALRISSASPVFGPASGVIGVGLASAMAGQAALAAKAWNKDHNTAAIFDPRAWKRRYRQEDILIDAALGISLFKIMGGSFRTIMPSDLSKVGAAARSSVPAAGVEYAPVGKKIELLQHFRKDGCHHCGTRNGRVIGDHMPPNYHVKLQQAKSGWWVRQPLVKWTANALGIPIGPPRQRYFPQCEACSQLQSAAIRHNKRRLVFHEVLHRGGRSSAWHASGVILGLRHMTTGAQFMNKLRTSSGSGGGRR